MNAESGFTLIELVITIVIMGFIATIMIPFIQSITHSPDPMIRQQAIALGQALMDEILAKRWDENTPLGGGPLNTGESSRGAAVATAVASLINEGEARTAYDDIDDYNDPSMDVIDTFSDQAGGAFTMTGFSRSVRVEYIPSNAATIDADTPSAVTSGNPTTDTKRIVVTVTSPLGEAFNFVAVECNI
ncbi:MAG: prepilin-type N-terminal cleavage/methylation domain-containing protein [Desulfobulbaceae bacterium]|nr:prepilin-type N-terminal cleavage/methylation domain-containing protein [Desulfobulbaceae bacterium]